MRSRTALLSAALLFAVVRPAPAADVGDILARMRGALEPGKDTRATVELVMTNAQGERVRWEAQYYRLDGPQARKKIVFDSPVDLRGVSIVFQRQEGGSDRTRVYLPFVRRVRELQADMRGEAFLGTDFNYEDLAFEELEFQRHTLRGEGDYFGRPCYDVESIPDRSWWYGRIARCIDKKDYLPRRTEYYDPAGMLYKVRTLERVEKVGAYPTALEITMDVIPTRTSSSILLHGVEYDVGLKPELFEGP